MTKRMTQIVVPLLIIAAIIGIWLIKNQTSEENFVSYDPSLLPEHLQDADFTLNIAAETDFSALTAYGLPIIIDYGADYCMPCKAMKPSLEAVNIQMYGKAFVKYVDVEENPEAVGDVPLQVIPTQLFINKDGTPFVPSDELAAQITFSKYNYKETGEHAFTIHQGILSAEQMLLILAEMGVE